MTNIDRTMPERAAACSEVLLPSDARSPIFIGGQRRSGTSLLRVLLNRHRNIAAGPESKFVQDPSFIAWHDDVATTWTTWLERYGFGRTEVDRAVAAMVDNLFTRYQLREGKVRWAEKTPTNILRIDYLFRLFPHAQFIHVIRDPRDTYCSIRQRALSDKPEWAKFRPRRAARDWCAAILAGKRFRPCTDRYMEVQYERLVSEPGPVMKQALDFLQEPWDPNILNPDADNQEARSEAQVRRDVINSASVGRWRTELTIDEVTDVQRVAGELMIELGYQPERDLKKFRHLQAQPARGW
jgi:hypothetical protein